MDIKLTKSILKQTAEGYEKIAEEFSATRFLLWPELEEFKEYIKKNNRVLDLGCGNGRLYELFKDLSIDYVGIDQSPALIKSAKDRWIHPSLPPTLYELRRTKKLRRTGRVKFLVGDILDLPKNIGKEKFNAVFLIAVLHHIPEYKLRLKIMKEAHSLISSDGYLFMTNWMFWQKKYFSPIIKYTFLKLIGKNKMDFCDIYIPWSSCVKTLEDKKSEKLIERYFHVFTKREINKLAKEAGFKIIKNKKSKWNYVTILKK